MLLPIRTKQNDLASNVSRELSIELVRNTFHLTDVSSDILTFISVPSSRAHYENASIVFERNRNAIQFLGNKQMRRFSTSGVPIMQLLWKVDLIKRSHWNLMSYLRPLTIFWWRCANARQRILDANDKLLIRF